MTEASTRSVMRQANPTQSTARFRAPRRPDHGTLGKDINLRSNHFAMKIPTMQVQHYYIDISPVCPRRVNRQVFNILITANQGQFIGTLPVYDGKHNIYVQELFQFGKEKKEFEIMLPDESPTERPFKVSINWSKEIAIDGDSEDTELSYDALQVVDTVLRHVPSSKYSPVGKSFYSPPVLKNGRHLHEYKLGGGREIWFGYHQSVRSSQWKTMLNIDVSATAFYGTMTMMAFLAEVLELPYQALAEKRILSDSQRVKFVKEVKHLKVEITHCGAIKRRYRVINVSRRPATTQTFPRVLDSGETIECTVAKYFKDKYNMDLKYQHLPCLQVGKEENHTYLPLEVCNLVPGQRCIKKLTDSQTSIMIKTTARTAPERQQEINHLMYKAQFASDKYVNDFGISINPSMTEVKGRVLPPPRMIYSGKTYSNPTQGIWDLRGKQFHTGIEVQEWAIVCFADQMQVKQNDLRNFTSMLQKISREAGMPITSGPCFCKYAVGVEQVESILTYLKSKYKKIQLVIVVLPGKTPVYAEVKRVGDTIMGVPTQCVQAKNVMRSTPQTISNICLKMNVKLGGVNCILHPSLRPPIFMEPVIFLGCDITHPPTSDTRNPSVASIVGSMDAHPSKYAATVRVQKSRVEMILEMSTMVKELLQKFYMSTHFKPSRIVVYRDGVSEGQFFNVLQYELRAIREACLMLETGYEPGITFIAVQKKHHTRLFSAEKKDQVGRSSNIPPGTTVDVGITHATEFDFYLCSHAGIQGTSRPSRYHVLWDDSNMKSDDVQQMTYQLCHTYARCTRSVSIPAPAYYAHLVALRARYHLADREHDSGLGSQSSAQSQNTNIAHLSKAVKVRDTNKMMKFM
ncbi:hypothetical protein CRE_08398 [Caenorhabditis remanei]|uniref:Uncharacterized protein n=1 Tax=Caenorhabditis remanei TaxID=31234 RepID=E3MPI4_CAERE|nr:hypothetical protein CRE_08398 [Caenorhabditis remanei]